LFVTDLTVSTTGPVKTDNLQKADQIEPVVNIDDSDTALSRYLNLPQTLAAVTVSTSSLPGLSEDGPAITHISILDK
jgi:hypothetical protein